MILWHFEVVVPKHHDEPCSEEFDKLLLNLIAAITGGVQARPQGGTAVEETRVFNLCSDGHDNDE